MLLVSVLDLLARGGHVVEAVLGGLVRFLEGDLAALGTLEAALAGGDARLLGDGLLGELGLLGYRNIGGLGLLLRSHCKLNLISQPAEQLGAGAQRARSARNRSKGGRSSAKGVWSSGMIPALGAGGPEFKSRIAPYFCLN